MPINCTRDNVMNVLNRQGRVVGTIKDKVFTKAVYGSKHMLRQPMAWALDADVFDRAVDPNCLSIAVIDRDTNTTYTVGVGTFKENRKVIDRGFGKQYYLDLIYWTVKR